MTGQKKKKGRFIITFLEVKALLAYLKDCTVFHKMLCLDIDCHHYWKSLQLLSGNLGPTSYVGALGEKLIIWGKIFFCAIQYLSYFPHGFF